MSTRRDLDGALRAWGDEAGPAPDPAFLARLEHRLRHDDGAVEVDLQPAGRVVPRRRRVGIAGVAAVAVAAVATAAAALGTFAPEHGVRVDPDADPTEVTLPLGPSTSTPAVVVPPATTQVSISAATTAVPASVAPTTTTAVDPGVSPSAPVQPTEPATTRATEPPTTEPPTTGPPITPTPTTTTTPPATTVAPPTTEVHPVATFSVTCAEVVVDTRPAIVCEWSEPPGGAAGYRILRGDQQAAVGRVLSPTPGTRRYVDPDIISGHTYSYLLHALDGSGTKTGQSNLVVVACCRA